MHQLFIDKRDDIAALCVEYDVLKLALFGSGARGVDFDLKTSDADFLVKFNRPFKHGPLGQYFGFARALERLLGRSVDLSEPIALDNPYFKNQVNRDGVMLYERT